MQQMSPLFHRRAAYCRYRRQGGEIQETLQDGITPVFIRMMGAVKYRSLFFFTDSLVLFPFMEESHREDMFPWGCLKTRGNVFARMSESE